MMCKRPAVYILLVSIPLAASACERQGDRPVSGNDSSPAAGQDSGAGTSEAGDPFSVMAMVHSAESSKPDPGAAGPPMPTLKWDGKEEGGPFSYASYRCVDQAPINDLSTNLTTLNSRLPQSRSPASIRVHPLEFTVPDGGDSGRLEGKITLVVCGLLQGTKSRALENTRTPDAERERVVFDWKGAYKRTSAEEVAWAGTFKIAAGTGRYEGIQGSGQLSGYFVCFEGCTLPEYEDGQVVLMGNYRAPNVSTRGRRRP